MKPFEGLIYLEYALPVLFAIILTLVFGSSRKRIAPVDRSKYFYIQAATYVAAIVGAKLAALVGDFSWPFKALPPELTLLNSGRSLVGALLAGFGTAEVLKFLLGYKSPPNDRFATVLPFSIAIGRLGCLLAGCCRGRPYSGPFAVTYSDGIQRFPAATIEILFHTLCGLCFVWLLRTNRLQGRVFACFLMAYAVFRFVTEFERATPVVFADLSAYQLMSVLMLSLGLFSFLMRSPELELLSEPVFIPAVKS